MSDKQPRPLRRVQKKYMEVSGEQNDEDHSSCVSPNYFDNDQRNAYEQICRNLESQRDTFKRYVGILNSGIARDPNIERQINNDLSSGLKRLFDSLLRNIH